MIGRLRLATAKAHRRGAWLLGAVLVAGALAAGTGWYYGGGPGSTSALPAVSGMTASSASTRLTAQGFRIGTTRTVWSTSDAGTVTSTVPTPGSELAPGSTVSLVLSKGERPASAPSVKGETAAVAGAAVTAARLTLAGRVERASSRAAGTAIRLIDEDGARIPPGTELQPGTAVRLVVSSGPAVAVQ